MTKHSTFLCYDKITETEMMNLPNVNGLDSINTGKIYRLTSTLDFSGSAIHSDEWRAYSQLLNNAAYTHLAINYSIHFVAPTTGI